MMHCVVDSPFTFNVTFRQATNYPVDLYVLMDISFSMKPLKDRLVNLTDSLGIRCFTFFNVSPIQTNIAVIFDRIAVCQARVLERKENM